MKPRRKIARKEETEVMEGPARNSERLKSGSRGGVGTTGEGRGEGRGARGGARGGAGRRVGGPA